MVETTAVQAVAVQRSPGDSLAMDRSSSSSSMGLVFDLISLATKPGAAPADVSVQPDASAVAANGKAVTLPTSDPSIPSPPVATMLPTIGDGPISVDALVAMDKTARQGLTAKPFIEKPAVEWMISVLSAAGLVKASTDGTKSPTPSSTPVSTPHSAQPTVEAAMAEVPPSQISDTAVALAAPSDAAIESPIALLKAPVDAVPTPISLPEALPLSNEAVTPAPSAVAPQSAGEPLSPASAEPLMAMANEMLKVPSDGTKAVTEGVQTEKPSVTEAALPALPSQTMPPAAMAETSPLPMAPAPALVSPAPSAPVQIPSPAPVAPATAQSLPTAPSLNGLPGAPDLSLTLPAKPDSDGKSGLAPALAEQPLMESPTPAAPVVVPVVAADAPFQAVEGVLATPASPAASPLIGPKDEALAPQADVVPPAPFLTAKKVDHSPKAKVAEKATLSTDAASPADNPVLPLPPMTHAANATPAAAADDSAERSEQEGFRPLGRRSKSADLRAVPASPEDRAAPATTPSPVTPARPRFEGLMAEKAQPSLAQGNEPNQPITVPEKRDDSAERPAPTTLAPHLMAGGDAHRLDQTMPQKPVIDGGNHAEGRLSSSSALLGNQTGSGADFQNSSSNQQNSAQNFDQSNGSATASHALPDHVTVEAVSIGSSHTPHDDTPSNATLNATTADQSAPLSVFTDAEPAKLSGSEFLSRPAPLSSTSGPSATSTAPAAPSPIRVDNPIFIAQRDKALQQQIISALRSGHDEIRLSLYPPQLGQVTINMALDGQKVKVGVKTANREATNLLVGERQSLAQALGHEGFTLEGFDVTDDAPKERSPEHELSENPIPTSQMAAESSFSLDITI